MLLGASVANKKEADQFTYIGEHHDVVNTQPPATPATAPSEEFARILALQVLDGDRGSYQPTVHFQRRMSERNFTLFNVIYVIRNGICICEGHSKEHEDYRYRFRHDIDGTEFDAVMAISSTRDMMVCPLLILITGCWKTSTGIRRKSY